MGFFSLLPSELQTGRAVSAPAEVVYIDDPLTSSANVTEREPSQNFSYAAGGASYPDPGGIENCSLGWGTVNAANVSPASWVTLEFGYKVVADNGTPDYYAHILADSASVNNIQDDFFFTVIGTAATLGKHVAAIDSVLDAAVVTALAAEDRISIRVTDTGGGTYTVEGLINDVVVCEAAGVTHAGTLGNRSVASFLLIAGEALTINDAYGVAT